MMRAWMALLLFAVLCAGNSLSQPTTLQALDAGCRNREPLTPWDSLVGPYPEIGIAARSAFLSPDDSKIAFFYERSRVPFFQGVVVYDLVRKTTLAMIPEGEWLRWSPDGRKLLTSYHLYDAESNSTSPLPVQITYQRPYWSFDGKHIYYQTPGEWYRGNSDGADTVAFGRFIGDDGQVDAKTFVTFYIGGIHIPPGTYLRHDVQSGKDSLVSVPEFLGLDEIMYPTISPDGRFMAADFYERGRNLLNGKQFLGVFDMLTNRLHRILPSQALGNLYYPSVTNRGTLVVSFVCRADSTYTVWEIDTNGLFLRRLIGGRELEDAVTSVAGPPLTLEHGIIALFPSPGRGSLNVTVLPVVQDDIRIDVLDLSGAIVQSIHAGPVEANIPRSLVLPIWDLPTGSYLMTVYGRRTRPAYRSFLVE
ncbi:MAG: hypothetical protein HY962_09630 [Ignavibacteriae bacterium]|nr:hypothetical protein [Ignavibacteriota bacterium]